MSLKDSKPFFTQQWQVEQAQTPPQAEPWCAPSFIEASSSDVPEGTSPSASSSPRGL